MAAQICVMSIFIFLKIQLTSKIVSVGLDSDRRKPFLLMSILMFLMTDNIQAFGLTRTHGAVQEG